MDLEEGSVAGQVVLVLMAAAVIQDWWIRPVKVSSEDILCFCVCSECLSCEVFHGGVTVACLAAGGLQGGAAVCPLGVLGMICCQSSAIRGGVWLQRQEEDAAPR